MGKEHPEELKAAIVKFVRSGNTMREAARKFGVSPSSVIKLLKKSDVTPKTYGKSAKAGAANDQATTDTALSAKEMAALLGVDTRSISNFASKGIIVRSGRNQYALMESVRLYCEHLREVAAGRGGDANQALASERARLAREQADREAMKNAELRKELIAASAVEREWADILRTVRSRLLACTSRIKSRLPHLTAHDGQTIDRELRDALSELSHDQDDPSAGAEGAGAAGQASTLGVD